MRIACLMPTYNRYPHRAFLVEEAVESFLRQDYEDRLLVIHNDAPEQKLEFDHPQVIVINSEERFPSLSSKIEHMIVAGQGLGCDAFCRWDDDDISLPWRLSLSVQKLQADPKRVEWRASNHWYAEANKPLSETPGPANQHVHALFTQQCLDLIGGYPKDLSGYEDQTFNFRLKDHAQPPGERLPKDQIYYLYRWGVSPHHLSGPGGDSENLIRHWQRIGTYRVVPGTYVIEPKWLKDHVARARTAAFTE